MSLWVIIFHINFLARLQPPMSSAMTEAEELTFCIMEFKTCLHMKLNKRFDFIRKDCSSVKSKFFGGNATLCILWKSISLDTCYELGDCGIFFSLMWAWYILATGHPMANKPSQILFELIRGRCEGKSIASLSVMIFFRIFKKTSSVFEEVESDRSPHLPTCPVI